MKTFTRRPIGNFFIKRELQIRLITKILLTVLITTGVCVGTLLLVFWLRYKSILIYQMNIEGDLSKENIVKVLLPSLLISAFVNIVLGFGVGLYASRKYAVPIYKLEQWALLLKNGHLTAKLRFREREEMKELSDHCNSLAADLRGRFVKIHEAVERLKERPGAAAEAAEIEQAVADLELQATVDVTTGFYAMSEGEKSKDSAKEPPQGAVTGE
jgi:methyl-accepting chemotaxis protein